MRRQLFSMKKSILFRKKLRSKSPIILVGAHNALSAKLVEEAGFDGVWASSFEISASHAMPDANILTMFETLNVVKSMDDKVNIPVIADCDNGYGNAINVIRTVEEFEKAGIAGICIEDNIFPKRCSFYTGVKRDLESIEEFAGKIKAAKSAQKTRNFFVIARTEALIAGWGQEEALRRAHAYAKAGADLIMPHSKKDSPDEVFGFAEAWYKEHKTPLVSVPTIYKGATASQLYKRGFKVVIFANHTVRSAVKGMREALATLREEQKAEAVDKIVVPLPEIYDLIGVAEMRDEEGRYLPKEEVPSKAIVLAAGAPPSPIKSLAGNLPVSMLDVRGQPLLQRQLKTLSDCKIHDVVVVRGYKKEKLNLSGPRYYDNPDYRKRGILHSLWLVDKELEGGTLISYGDLLYDEAILEKLLSVKKDIVLVIDRAWNENKGVSRNPDLVITVGKPVKSPRFYPLEKDNRILAIGKKIDPQKANGEFIGLALFSQKGVKILKKAYRLAKRRYKNKTFHESENFAKGHFNDIIQEIIELNYPVYALNIYKGWLDVDSFEDYRKVWAKLA